MSPCAKALAKLSAVKEDGGAKGLPAAKSSGERTEVRTSHTKG